MVSLIILRDSCNGRAGALVLVGVVGGVILSTLAVLVAFVIRRRRKRDAGADADADADANEDRERRPLPQPHRNSYNPYYVSSLPDSFCITDLQKTSDINFSRTLMIRRRSHLR